MAGSVEWEQQIEEATARIVATITAADERTWTTRPPVGPWSICEVVEHVAIANENILRAIEHGLVPIEAPPDVTDEEMPYLFYRGDEPPNVARPTGTWTDRDEAIARLRATSDALASWARTTTVDLRSVGMAHPVFGMLDGGQWLRFAAVHTWRHRAQVSALHEVFGDGPGQAALPQDDTQMG